MLLNTEETQPGTQKMLLDIMETIPGTKEMFPGTQEMLPGTRLIDPGTKRCYLEIKKIQIQKSNQIQKFWSTICL